MATFTGGRHSGGRRRARVPAPLLLVVVPTRMVVRVVRKRRKERREDARRERLVDRRVSEELATRGVPEAPAAGAASAPAPAESASADRVEHARRWLYRHRRDVAAPAAVAVALVVLRQAMHVASGWSYWSLGLVAVPMLTVAAGGVWWLRQVDPRGVSHKTRVAAAVTVIAAPLWLASPARLPLPFWPHHVTLVPELSLAWLDGWLDVLPDWPLTYPLLVAWTAAAIWFRHRRFRTRVVEVTAPGEGPEVIWASTHGSEGWSLAGTALTNVTRIITPDGVDVGWKSPVACVPGKHNATKVTAQAEDIAGVYGREKKDVSVERTGNAFLPMLAVMTRDPFEDLSDLDEPFPLGDDGVAQLGTFYDGEPACTQLWQPGAGSFDTWVFGKKGAGKSETVNSALGSWLSRRLVCLDFTDLKGGTSLPQWQQAAHRYGTTVADGLMTLRRLDAIGQARLAAMAQMVWYAPGDPEPRQGVSVLEPSLEWPIWLGGLEEAPRLWLIREAVEIAERIMTLYRACLVSLFAVSQMAELKQAWGNSSTLREQIQSGNVGAGYVGTSQAHLGFDHFKPNLGLIEKKSYRWFLTSPHQSREAILRVRRLRDPWAVARASLPGTPNPVDLEAIQEVEERAAKDARRAEQAADGAAGDAGGGIGRASVLAALKAECRAAGGSVKLAAVARRLAPKDMDDMTRRRHENLIGKHLAELVKTGDAEKPRWGEYAA
jgi:hypothetical protein